MKNTIRIEGGTYTSMKSALKYVRRRRAIIVCVNGQDMLRFIRDVKLTPVEPEADPVTGKFNWFVDDSGGSSIMKAYEGISGGYRVLQASHAQ